MNDDNIQTRYQWFILALAALTHTFTVAIPTMCMPVLFDEISNDLGLSLVQIGAVWGIGSLAGIVTGLIGGTLGDRYGTKRTLAISCVLAGFSGALRGLSVDFYTLLATFFVFGFLTPAIPMNVHKVCGLWFSRKQLGLANGIVSAGMALGFALGAMISATIMSPWLGGWRNVLYLYGAVSVGVGLLWSLTPTLSSERDVLGGKPSIWQALTHVVRVRHMWILGIAILGMSGSVQGVLGYLPLYLREIGWSAASADGALSAFHTISLICAIPIALFSDRIGSRKQVLVFATLLSTLGTGLLAIVGGSLIWVSVLMAGVFRDGFMAVFMTTILEVDEVGALYAGTAMGFVMLFGRLGGLVAPPLGNSLAEIAPGIPFIFWAALAATSLIGFHFIHEVRPFPVGVPTAQVDVQ